MINQQLLEYIRAQIKVGASKEDIKKTLASGGWNEQDATEAFMAIEGVQVPSVPLRPAAAPPSVSATGVPIAAPRPVAIPIPISTPPVVVQKRSNWRLVLGIILAVFLLAIAGGVYAVMTYPGLADYVPAPLQDLLRGTPPVETPPTSEEQPIPSPTETATTTLPAATSTPTTTTSH